MLFEKMGEDLVNEIENENSNIGTSFESSGSSYPSLGETSKYFLYPILLDANKYIPGKYF